MAESPACYAAHRDGDNFSYWDRL